MLYEVITISYLLAMVKALACCGAKRSRVATHQPGSFAIDKLHSGMLTVANLAYDVKVSQR